MKAKYIVATFIVIYRMWMFLALMQKQSVIKKQERIIKNQSETIEDLTVKFIGTIEEQELINEANKLLKERNNAK